MLGFGDPWILIVFILCIASALVCLCWGVWHWNRDDGVSNALPDALKHWAEEEDRVESEL